MERAVEKVVFLIDFHLFIHAWSSNINEKIWMLSSQCSWHMWKFYISQNRKIERLLVVSLIKFSFPFADTARAHWKRRNRKEFYHWKNSVVLGNTFFYCLNLNFICFRHILFHFWEKCVCITLKKWREEHIPFVNTCNKIPFQLVIFKNFVVSPLNNFKKICFELLNFSKSKNCMKHVCVYEMTHLLQYSTCNV